MCFKLSSRVHRNELQRPRSRHASALLHPSRPIRTAPPRREPPHPSQRRRRRRLRLTPTGHVRPRETRGRRPVDALHGALPGAAAADREPASPAAAAAAARGSARLLLRRRRPPLGFRLPENRCELPPPPAGWLLLTAMAHLGLVFSLRESSRSYAPQSSLPTRRRVDPGGSPARPRAAAAAAI